ncbi:hypothetical protein [Streptomyces sp. NPDC048659]|uniref:hypothetical protein n=1 Tax=Streptomyces sp. NPDC048659 TaxID=3155489 RepID=UPI0034363644
MYIRTRGVLALATAAAVSAGLCTALTTPAYATGTQTAGEVVIPNPGRFVPRSEQLGQVGATGYAHRQEGGNGWVWTDTASGTDAQITQEQATKGHSGLYASVETDPAVTVDRVKVKDLATGQQRLDVAVPQGRKFTGAFAADTVVTATTRPGGAYLDALQLIRVVDGTPTEQALPALPEAFAEVEVLQQDSRGALLRFNREAGQFGVEYLLDYATASLKPTAPAGEGVLVTLGADRIAYYDTLGYKIRTAPRTEPKQTTETNAPSLQDTWDAKVALVGDWFLIAEQPSQKVEATTTGHPLKAVRVGTGEVRDLLPHAAAQLATAPDGSVLAVGGTGADAWGVHRVTVGEDGAPKLVKVAAVPAAKARYGGLALGGGRLNLLSDSVSGIDTLGLYDVDTDLAATPPTAGDARLRARVIAPSSPGLVALGDGDSAYVDNRRITVPTGATTRRTADLPVANATPVDGAGRYVLARRDGVSYVADLENDGSTATDVRYTVDGAAALWGSQVWKAGANEGQVVAYDLAAGTTSAPVDLGSHCTPTELQAVDRWLYWSCGADGAGVYDQELRKSVAVPAGEALLGDGFVVRHEGDLLKLTEAASGQTRDLADLPAGVGSGRGSTWTVDKFGGGVAFVDGAKNVHVKSAGVDAQPLKALQHSVEPLTFTGSGVEPAAAVWAPEWRFSKAVGSWELRIAKGDGEGVRTFSGTRGDGSTVRVQWDGKDAKGRAIESNQYRWELTVRPLDGVGPARGAQGVFDVKGSSLSTLPGTYTPVTPTRLLDTREGLGAAKAKVGPNGTVRLKVAGAAGVPAEGLTSVVLNVTATNATADGFVSVYPSGTLRTSSSSLNFKAGKTAANLVTVPVTDGYVELYNKNGSVDLLADIAGYYAEGTSGSTYQPVSPKRLMDTRDGTGVAKGAIQAGGTVTLAVTEPGVTAVALNITATNATAAGFVSAYPYGTARPNVSNVNFEAGRTVPNMAVVPVKDGKITFYNRAGSVDVLADVAGYFKEGSGALFTGMQPKRLMDTRNGTGVAKAKVGAGQTVSLTVGTKYKAVVLNVTATNVTASSFVSVYPYGTARPSASNLNVVAGQTVPNGVIVPVKDGKVTFYNHNGSVDLIADVTGYYTD